MELNRQCKCYDPVEEGRVNCPGCKLWNLDKGKCRDEKGTLEKNRVSEDDDTVGWSQW